MSTSPETAPNSNPSPKTVLAESLEQIGRSGVSYCKNGGLYYAVVSDIHLGHNKNPASRIVRNLFTAFPDNEDTASLDIIFIAGDVFDDVLFFNDEDIDDVKWWVNSLLHLCKKHRIKLRVLEGTPGHDRKQSEYFVWENEINNIGCDLKYIDKLDIEYMEDLDIHILYVPDELPGGPETTLRNVKDLMRARGIEQVDHAVMHGLFRFQLPNHVENVATHDAQEYLRLVKHNIFIGHDHTNKEFERIFVQGSFDRLGHGYETPKGHMRAKHRPDGSWEIRFIENTDAMMFVTVNAMGLPLDDTLDLVRQMAGNLPDDSHVRIRAESNNPVFTSMDSLLQIGPTLNWAKDPQRDKEKALAPLAETNQRYVPISITPQNLGELLLEKIANDGASGEIMDASIEILEDLFPESMKQRELDRRGFAVFLKALGDKAVVPPELQDHPVMQFVE